VRHDKLLLSKAKNPRKAQDPRCVSAKLTNAQGRNSGNWIPRRVLVLALHVRGVASDDSHKLRLGLSYKDFRTVAGIEFVL
jgi:hypothetical protein